MGQLEHAETPFSAASENSREYGNTPSKDSVDRSESDAEFFEADEARRASSSVCNDDESFQDAVSEVASSASGWDGESLGRTSGSARPGHHEATSSLSAAGSSPNAAAPFGSWRAGYLREAQRCQAAESRADFLQQRLSSIEAQLEGSQAPVPRAAQPSLQSNSISTSAASAELLPEVYAARMVAECFTRAATTEAVSKDYFQQVQLLSERINRMSRMEQVDSMQAMQDQRREQQAAEAARLAHKRLQRSAIVVGWVAIGVGAGYLALHSLRSYQAKIRS